LTLAYAVTIHKSQGSEYPAVVLPIHTQHYIMLQRNLLYTALTRGKRLVCVVGSRNARWAAPSAIQPAPTVTRRSPIFSRKTFPTGGDA
jgi:exodeoxyribonuclease V alpha subunit